MDDPKRISVGIVGAGEMGSAIGRRLLENGCRVFTELHGRGPSSQERVRAAGIEVIANDDEFATQADFILSIVPPGVAVNVAQRFRGPIDRTRKKPTYVECNAISPATTRRIEGVLAETKCAYIDAGIIGGPPPLHRPEISPRIYASGEDAHSLTAISQYGLDIAVLDGPIGAASALKMAYGGLTKGLAAIGTAMVAVSARHGLADALSAELARSQPELLKHLKWLLLAMPPKAYRWVAEMEQIAEYLEREENGDTIYKGAARLYEHIAAEVDSRSSNDVLLALAAFCSRQG